MKRQRNAFFLLAAACVWLASCGPTPADLKVEPEKVVLDGRGDTAEIEATIVDEEGNPITEGYDLTWFSTDTDLFKLTQNGEVTAEASGEGTVEIEVVGTELKASVPVRVKIASSISTSHEKSLRLWTGQVKDDVWAEVHSEKGAFIEGFKPEWSSADPSIVEVESIDDPERRQSWVKMTGLKSGNTYVTASFRNLSKQLIVRVYDEDEEVNLAGERLGKKKDKEEESDK
ncbi:MAG: hypothetical protein R6V85_14590 [Polyangia bacterium]